MWHVPIHDELAAVLAFDLENAVVQAPVHIDLRVGERTVERFADGDESRIGRGDEFGVGEHAIGTFESACSAMARASIGLMLRDAHRLRSVACICAAAIAMTLGTAACGIKGPLKPA